jgi:hypothetical protein
MGRIAVVMPGRRIWRRRWNSRDKLDHSRRPGAFESRETVRQDSGIAEPVRNAGVVGHAVKTRSGGGPASNGSEGDPRDAVHVAQSVLFG